MQQNAGMIFNTPHESIPKTKKNEEILIYCAESYSHYMSIITIFMIF